MKNIFKTKKAVLAIFMLFAVLVFVGWGTMNGTRSFREFYDGSVSWQDSVYNIDSLAYPYYGNGGKFEDFSLVNGQTVNYRARYVSAGTTSDSLWLIVQTRTESGPNLVTNCDTVLIVGSTSTAALTAGSFTFSATTAQLWRFRIEDANPLTVNRNNGYFLFTVWSNTINTIPTNFRLGNYPIY